MTRRSVVFAVLGGLLAGSSLPAAARVYRWADRDGNAVFSDRPPQPEAVPLPPETKVPELGPLPAQPRQAPHPVADELLSLSGLKRQTQGMATHVRTNLVQSLGQLAPGDQAAVERVTSKGFHHETLYALIKEEFSRRIDEARIKDVLAWYRSPLGRRLTELEVAFSGGDREHELTEFAARLRVAKPDPRRVALVQRLDGASGATEMSVELIVAVAQAIMRVADPLVAADRRLKPGQLESHARQIRLQTQEPLRQTNTLVLLHLYRDVDDQDIARYIQFYESEAGSWLSPAVRKAVITAVAGAVERTAAELVRLVPPERWGQGGQGGFKKPPLPVPGERL